ncbi:MAG TPA: DUF4956 domain-containing protein [Bacteroidales bacterium]|nr:DUF4956 domain-containing protein [Bacteroidales bacterium]
MTDLLASQFFGSVDLQGAKEFLIRFGLNLVTLVILIRFLYYEYRKEGIPEYLFGFFLMGVAVFMICTVLDMVDFGLELAIGLFALFGILRFRTQAIPVREMTYLFLVIAVSMINSLVDFADPVNGIILYNTLIIIPVWILEIFLCTNKHLQKEIVYDNLDDVYKGEEHLREVLTEKTGLKIIKVKIGKIDYIKQQATLTLFYYQK